MRTLLLILVAAITLSAEGNTVFFCCENHKGITRGPFCKLFEGNKYYVDSSKRCKRVGLKSKVKGGSNRRYLGKVYPSTVRPKYAYIYQYVVVCPNEDDDNPRVAVKERESNNVQVEVTLSCMVLLLAFSLLTSSSADPDMKRLLSSGECKILWNAASGSVTLSTSLGMYTVKSTNSMIHAHLPIRMILRFFSDTQLPGSLHDRKVPTHCFSIIFPSCNIEFSRLASGMLR